MEKIPNVFLQIPNYRCFGCSPVNEHGLRLEFFALPNGDCVTELIPGHCFSGFPGLCHGGIASSVLDELAFWTLFNAYKRFGVTARLELKYKLPTPADKHLVATGSVLERKGDIVTLNTRLTVGDTGIETVSGKVVYYIVDKSSWEKVTGSPVHPSIEQYFP